MRCQKKLRTVYELTIKFWGSSKVKAWAPARLGKGCSAYLIDPLARAICYTPPHLSGNCRKFSFAKTGARKGFIQWMWPRVER